MGEDACGDDPAYVRGPTGPQVHRTPTFEFKAATPGGTGGGYPRVRSTERRPHTARQGREGVAVSIHRLCALAWLVPDEMTAADVLAADLLAGHDVHHTLGMPSANLESHLQLVEHGSHSEVTQAEMRAWAADSKRTAGVVDGSPQASGRDASRVCARCGAESETLCTWAGTEDRYCPECAAREADGATIEVV